ncbi:ribonuclease Z [Bacillus canaveralius]|uniref:Ribonuclease Z n=1 Tax=Bacillus canaveralius TaxID=1403243 RepID=A0A2N5GRH3_9BACI|nr:MULTISPECIES: ribonuclease Z [Bacillus]PLR84528.1 ribonuclease Z [Bacillus sp. V33-4]PLR86042.1 ribonuclease Z [Bacillus canaveralius]PLS00161.1 ribonuclease Z [Bacillus canaveralius]RSK52078.1 ribonuclease Z [Bacillus canaveralius]
MDVFFLGTGAGVPARMRNVTAIALKLLEERGAIWLFDCGEATQHQILHTSIKPRRIEKIFITHLHGDHIYGLPGLLSSRSFQAGESEVTLYGPKGLKDYIVMSLSISHSHLRYPLKIVEIDEGIVFEDDQFTVEARLLDHGIPSFGYRVVEKDRPGTLLAEKLDEAGLKPGPLYKKIKNGEDVVLEDGTVIHAAEFLDPPKKGRIVTILGDTRVCNNAVELAREADLLVHEATLSKDEEKMAFDYFHSTTHQAAQVALKANASKLIITHISSRYDRPAWKELEKEAQELFKDTEIAVDFMEISIPMTRGHF